MSRERWRLPAMTLPEGEERELWVVDGRLTDRPVDDAQPLPGRFVLPGLVDAHSHASLGPGQAPLDLIATDETLTRLAASGVLAIRDVGSPADLMLDLVPSAGHPHVEAAGQWLAPAGRYYERLHRPVAAHDLVATALAQIQAGARWIKVVADWTEPGLSYERATLEQLVEAAHAAGARVAAHTQGPSVADVIAAGVDSVEHGCGLTVGDLETMAASGIAWTPTLLALSGPLPVDAPPEREARRLGWLDNARTLLAPAGELGVTILAGTDTAGPVAGEIRQLIDYGLSPGAALRAATTDARAYLGLPALEMGATADLLTFGADPRADPEVLAEPVAVVLGGNRIR